MAKKACTDLKYKFYNGGWSSWQSALNGGYAGSSGYVVVLRFKTPNISTFVNPSLNITIPYVRQTWANFTGYMYIKLATKDPTTKGICTIPTKSTCDAYTSWDTYDAEVHKASFTISASALEANTTYYLIIGSNRNFIEIGYSSEYDDWFSIQVSYTSYTDVKKGSVIITDNGDNSCTITAKAGTKGTNNPVKSATLQYNLGTTLNTGCTKKDFTEEQLTKGLTTIYKVPTKDYDKATSIFSIAANVITKGTYGPSSTSDLEIGKIKHYTSPILTNKIPKISYTKSKITNKEDWTFSWEAATAGNENSPVAGYRLGLIKNNTPMNVTISSISNYLTAATTSYYADILGADKCSIKIRPSDFDFKPYDFFSLSVRAFSKNGKNEKLFSTARYSSIYTVESAGTVRVKVYDTASNEAWTEGQVFVKVYDSAQNEVWVEADEVNVKVYDNVKNEVWVTSE